MSKRIDGFGSGVAVVMLAGEGLYALRLASRRCGDCAVIPEMSKRRDCDMVPAYLFPTDRTVDHLVIAAGRFTCRSNFVLINCRCRCVYRMQNQLRIQKRLVVFSDINSVPLFLCTIIEYFPEIDTSGKSMRHDLCRCDWDRNLS